ncbi:MAG: hypothetical protein ABSB52_01995 [Acidimicrobiales bacterium]|jgi:hypothetical protein
MGSQVLPTPAEVMAKATKMLQRVMLLQVLWFACFMAGGLWTIWTAWKNTHLPAYCSDRVRAGAAAMAACSHHSYGGPVILVLVGIVGLFVTGYVATRLAVRYLGAGAAAFLRGGRRFVGPMGPRGGAEYMGGGFPGSSGGMSHGPGPSLPQRPPEPPQAPPRA